MNIVIYKVNKIEKNKTYLSYYNLYGDLTITNKPLIFIAYDENYHYQLIDYNNNLISSDYGIIVDSKTNIKTEDNLDSEYHYNLFKYSKNNFLIKTKNDYPFYPGNNNGDTFYKDIIEYIKSTIVNLKKNSNNTKKTWPKYIENLKDTKTRDNKKRLFRLKASKYIYYKNSLYINKNDDHIEMNNKLISLIVKDNDDEITDIIKNNKKIFRIPTLFECIDLIKKFHSDTNHRSNDALKEKFKEEKISWKGISNDINYFIHNCVTCQLKNSSIVKRPFIKQILFDKPRQRYILDLSELPDLIKENTDFKYFMHLIDHYSKFLFGLLLKDKKGDTILKELEHIFLTTGFPKEICCDNGKEFRNSKFSQFLNDNNVKEIHGLPRKPHSQGVCERVHQTIAKDLIAKILEDSQYDYLNIERDYKKIIYNYNNLIHHSTKYKPIFLFYHNTEALSEIVKNNCKRKFSSVNKNASKFNVGEKILLNPKFLVSGNNLISNKVKKGKIIYRYPGEIVKILEGGYYEIKIALNIKKFNIRKNEIYKVYYDLLKVCNDSVWNDICNNTDTDFIDSPINSDSSSLDEISEQNESVSDDDDY